ncbi:MAG TPA: hypothetical protein PK954_15060 [Anaerolineales bacterium]|nr:hypothetical protein [Anaerolineales bacterium]HRF49412.1 hypothetical protein [Anaerolineales bacterium]
MTQAVLSTQALLSLEDAKSLIASGRNLLLAGDERLLAQLPTGSWIGGTIPYFMASSGGTFSREGVFVTELPGDIVGAEIKTYDPVDLANVYQDIPADGFGVIILPASSAAQLEFAIHAPEYAGFAMRPLVGWVSGVDLADLGKVTPKVFDGRTGASFENGAVVMHVQLPEDRVAEIGIINLFSQGPGDVLQFAEAGFSAGEVLVNGEPRNFAAYIKEKQLNLQLPLVADYAGAMINISFQGVDEANGRVNFYAPVFPGVTYRQAKPVVDYVTDFNQALATADHGVVTFSCNCILNYLFSQLEGKQTGSFTGPITFGEVAYQLLNQTMVYLTITDIG